MFQLYVLGAQSLNQLFGDTICHIDVSKHLHVSLIENEDMWKIGNSEKQELKKI